MNKIKTDTHNNSGDKMKLIIWKTICIPLIFILSSIFHMLYEWYPSIITSLFSGINESIWEHNKIIFSAFLIITIIEKIYYKKNKNILFIEAISMISCMILTMLMFTPIYFYLLKYQDNMLVTLIIFIIAIILSQIISYILINKDKKENLEKIGILIWIIIFVMLSLLTYYPLNLKIFKDFSKK